MWKTLNKRAPSVITRVMSYIWDTGAEWVWVSTTFDVYLTVHTYTYTIQFDNSQDQVSTNLHVDVIIMDNTVTDTIYFYTPIVSASSMTDNGWFFLPYIDPMV